MSSNNSIYTIFPYKLEGQWVFDDENKGLYREALVSGADTFLDILSEGAQKAVVIFSDGIFPDADVVVDLMATDESGSSYYSKDYEHELWLCPALFLYYKPAPKQIFIKVKITENGTQKGSKEVIQKNRRPQPQAQSKARSKKGSKTKGRTSKGR